MKSPTLVVSLTVAALMMPAAAVAQSVPQSTSDNARQSIGGQNDVLGNLLGAIFGNQATAEQTLETDWNQGRRPFAQRRQTLETRIAASVNSGAISRSEADAIRDEYDDIVDTEARYSANGAITTEERRDLRARYRALIARVGDDRGPSDGGSGDNDYQSIIAQRADFDARTNTALRQRRISTSEAQRLRSDFQALVQIEAGYRRNGVDARERADLETRLAALDSRLNSGGFGNDSNPARWNRFEARIAAGERNGRLSRSTAVQLRTELADLTRLDAAYAANGLNTDERTYLTRRFAEIEARVGGTRR